jgi:uncharacterized membrane protein YraQ (UPF0718 family)
MKNQLIKSIKKSALSQWNVLPIILATILLISLVFSIIPKNLYVNLLGSGDIYSLFIASVIGSISAGNPTMSYVIGGELLKQGIGLTVVTVFIVSWVTVGVVQFPAEATILGRKFAVHRNVTAFLLSFVVALITVYLYGIFSR